MRPVQLVRSVAGIAFIAALVAACGDSAGGDAGEATASVVRDSAGIRIVESGARTSGVLTLSAEPILTIGEMEGAEEYQFHNVNHATRLSDGTFVVANGGSNQLRFYDESGRHIRSSGGRGSGPGEFEFISYLRRIEGDTLLVHDARNRRVTVLAPDGAYVRDFTLEGPAGEVISDVEAAAADGSLLVTGERDFPMNSTDIHRDTMKFSVLRGDSLTRIRDYLGREMSMRTEGGNGQMMVMLTEVAFGRGTMTAASADRFYIASNDSYEIHRYDLDGNLEAIIRSAHVPVRPVDNAVFAEYAEGSLERRRRFAEQQGREFDPAEAKKSIEAAPRAPTVPVFSDILAADDGSLWVQEYVMAGRDDEPTRWTVFAPDGAMRGTIELPARFEPLHIAGETLTGVITDEYDVEYVHVYTVGG